MKAVRKVSENKKLETKLDYKLLLAQSNCAHARYSVSRDVERVRRKPERRKTVLLG